MKLVAMLVSCGVRVSVLVVEPSFRLFSIQQLLSANLATWYCWLSPLVSVRVITASSLEPV